MSGAGNILTGTDEPRLVEFDGKAPRDLLEFVALVFARVNAKPALGASKRHVDDRALERHQRRKCFDFLLIDTGRIADAALQGKSVVTVIGAPTFDDAPFPPNLDGKSDRVHGPTTLDDFGEAGGKVQAVRRLIDHAAHAL